MKKTQIIFLFLSCLLSIGLSFAQTKKKDPNAGVPFTPNPQTDAKTLKHFTDMKFGVMITWGPYTPSGKEVSWSMHDEKAYQSYYTQWNPINWSPNEWGDVIKKVGAKYLVWIAKHHDGFCLWDTKTTDYNVMNLPYHKDVTAEIAKMCKKYDIDLGLYLSIIDAHFSGWNRIYAHGAKTPGFPEDIPKIAKLTELQGLEMLNKYHPFELWFDGGWLDGWRSSIYPKQLEAVFRKVDPSIIMTRLGNYVDDYGSLEAKIGVYSPYPWETVTSVSYPRYYWSPTLKYKSVDYLIESMCRVVVGNGNYLLSFVPDPNGHIPDVQQNIAKEMGEWVRQNNEAIFNTKAGPYYPNKWGGSTHEGKNVYLYVLPGAEETIHLPPINARIVSTKTLTGGNGIKVLQTKKGLTIHVPNNARDKNGIAIIKLRLNKKVDKMIEASNPKAPLNLKIDNAPKPIQDRKGKVLDN